MLCFTTGTHQQNNGGCDHICNDTQHRVRCSCHNGYQLFDDDDKSCIGEHTLTVTAVSVTVTDI